MQAATFPPMAINIQSQDTGQSPLKDFYDLAQAACDQAQVLSYSVVLGFPYADVSEMGSSILVVTDGDTKSAESIAQTLGQQLWDQRAAFEPDFLSPKEAVKSAIKEAKFPAVLLDMGDNVGGGSPADGTSLLHELHSQRATQSFVCLYDPAAVKTASSSGSGSRISFTVGGNTDSMHGSPFEGTFEVLSIHDGTFTETETRHGGYTDFDQGQTAILRTTDTQITIMLTSKRVPPFSLAQLTSFGLDPTQFDILVAKGVIAPLAAYRPIANRFLFVDTPGVTRADMRQLEYQHRRKPMFPFEALS